MKRYSYRSTFAIRQLGDYIRLIPQSLRKGVKEALWAVSER